MLDFIGLNCPVCGKTFTKDDDIVVCPECGAPYHRACYQQEGQCIFPELHEEGKEWKPPAPPPKEPETPAATAEIKDRECPVCGTLNGHSAIYCSRCGSPLSAQRHAAPPMPPFAFDPMGGVNPTEYLDSGVTFGDVSKLVRQNTNYYMPVFRYIHQSGRNKFNFSAFLLSGAWLLYRKQYRMGIFFTVLMACLYVLFQCSYWLISWPSLLEAATKAGLGNVSMEDFLLMTDEQTLAISAALAQDGLGLWKLLLPFLFLAGILACMIVVGVRGNRMYLNHCVRCANEIKLWGGEGGTEMTPEAKGGVNTPVALCVFFCYFILRNVLPLLLIGL